MHMVAGRVRMPCDDVGRAVLGQPDFAKRGHGDPGPLLRRRAQALGQRERHVKYTFRTRKLVEPLP